jgi:Uma2 family endonuclease
MTEAGVFGPEDRLELLDGEIIDRAPQKSRHATAVTLVADALRTHFGPGATVRVQLPFSLDDRSEPEPDVAVVPDNPHDYRDAHPSRALLVCEVSDTTLA